MKTSIAAFHLITIVLISLIKHSCQLECYVCQNQGDNKSKCTETVKTCELAQEQCLTEVRWGTAPYWALTSQKQHFISKRCATKQECQEWVIDKHHKCDRIWYNDWNCTTCCSGDKCNYFVTLAVQSKKPFDALVLLSYIVSVSLMYYTRTFST